MTMTPDQLRMSPYEVAEETFVIPWMLEAPPVGLFCMNSLVIRGEQPMVVDTGSPANRDEWLENLGSVVDPSDVRWIFLSHDDRDHAGNLLAALEACPNATLLTTWFSVGRMAEEWMTPLDRCRFLNENERLDLGDRTITTVRPPVFDNPTTRGVFDDRTGVLWSVDTFANPVSAPLEDAHDISDADFAEGQLLGGRIVSPWHPWLDERKYHAHIDTIQALPIEVIASCHAPAIRGDRIARPRSTSSAPCPRPIRGSRSPTKTSSNGSRCEGRSRGGLLQAELSHPRDDELLHQALRQWLVDGELQRALRGLVGRGLVGEHREHGAAVRKVAQVILERSESGHRLALHLERRHAVGDALLRCPVRPP